jgi:hypothetical protein
MALREEQPLLDLANDMHDIDGVVLEFKRFTRLKFGIGIILLLVAALVLCIRSIFNCPR